MAEEPETQTTETTITTTEGAPGESLPANPAEETQQAVETAQKIQAQTLGEVLAGLAAFQQESVTQHKAQMQELQAALDKANANVAASEKMKTEIEEALMQVKEETQAKAEAATAKPSPAPRRNKIRPSLR